MPASTLGQLSARLSAYTTPEGPVFADALYMVQERIYGKGLWRDTTEELVLEVQDDYTIAIPTRAESILFSLVDSSDGLASSPSAPVRPLWHDYRLFGRSSTGMSGAVGLTDAGYSVGRSHLVPGDGYSVRFSTETLSNFTGDEEFIVNYTDSENIRYTEEISPSGVATITTSNLDIREIHSISWTGITIRTKVELVNTDTDLNDPDFGLIATPSGVLRTRRYRQSIAAPGQNLRVLVKLKAPYPTANNDVVSIGNTNALKHGLLALIAEDAADSDRAEHHWGECVRALNEELESLDTGTDFTINLQIGGFGQDPIPSIL